jgi:transcriptional adapter 2-alpha
MRGALSKDLLGERRVSVTGSPTLPLPCLRLANLLNPASRQAIEQVRPVDVDTFPTRKASRLQELQSRPIPLPPPKPMASAPTCHELGGYMPGRLEFEHEWENEAEMLIKDMEFGRVYHFGGNSQPAGPPTLPAPPAEGEAPDAEVQIVEEKPLPDGEKEGDEPEAELDLKLSVLEMFNERYDKRMGAKELIFDRGLIHYKTVRFLPFLPLLRRH